MLASKYEEAECIITRDVVQAAHGDLRMDDVIRLEWRAARALGYRLDGGTARCWVLHLLGVKMRDLPPDVRYRLDRSLLLGEYLALPPRWRALVPKVRRVALDRRPTMGRRTSENASYAACSLRTLDA